MEYYLALAGAVLGALSLVLHALGPKLPKAEKAAEDLDVVDALLPKPPTKPAA